MQSTFTSGKLVSHVYIFRLKLLVAKFRSPRGLRAECLESPIVALIRLQRKIINRSLSHMIQPLLPSSVYITADTTCCTEITLWEYLNLAVRTGNEQASTKSVFVKIFRSVGPYRTPNILICVFSKNIQNLCVIDGDI